MIKSALSLSLIVVLFASPVAIAAELIEVMPGKSLKRSRGMNVEANLQNDHSSSSVRVMVDHENRIYREGELMKVSVLSEKSGYLYLFYRQADGSTKCLFPNLYASDNSIRGGEPITIPTSKQKFRLRATKPFGDELLVALVTEKPIAVERTLGAKSLTKSTTTLVNLDTLARSILENKGINVEGTGETLSSNQWAEHHVLIKSVAKDTQTSTTTQHRRIILAVGISDYKDDRITDLRVSHMDAVNMVKTLKEHSNLDAYILLVEEKATRKNIKQAFGELAAKTNPGDEIIIFWSGHGGTFADVDGDETANSLDEFLVPYDANIDDMANTVVTDDTLGQWVQTLDGRKVVVIFDACHSGGNAEQGENSRGNPLKGDGGLLQDVAEFDAETVGNLIQEGRNGEIKGTGIRIGLPAPVGHDFMRDAFRRISNLHTKDIRAQDAVMLLSCLATETSAERRDGKGSVMTYALIKKIENSNSLTLEQAYQYLSVEVPKYMNKHFPGHPQTPQLVPLNGSSVRLR